MRSSDRQKELNLELYKLVTKFNKDSLDRFHRREDVPIEDVGEMTAKIENLLDQGAVFGNFKRLEGYDSSSVGEELLRQSAKKCDVELVRLLAFAPGINVNKGQGYGITALMMASNSNSIGEDKTISESLRVEMVRILLSTKDVNVNACDRGGNTALAYASAYSHKVTQEILAADEINVNAQNHNGTTVLKSVSELFEIYSPQSSKGLNSKKTSNLIF